MTNRDNGIANTGPPDEATTITIACFLALALYNVLELTFITFATFKQRGGLYFYSFLTSTWGIGLYSVGFLLKHLKLSTISILYVTLIVIGWCCMVTGQSVVLYSRLHLLLRNRKTMRALLIMIIVNAFVCHGPIIVMVYGANSANPDPFVGPYSIYEKVQVTIFFIQELIISGFYLVEAVKLSRLDASIHGRSGQQLVRHLIVVNVIIIILDITILALEYAGLYDIQTSYKALVYGAKLKLEFSILNRLVELTKSRSTSGPYTHNSEMDTMDGERPKRTTKNRGVSGVVGYKASVHAAKYQLGGTKTPDFVGEGRYGEAPGSVVMTTEVVVKREGMPAESDGERDLDSVGTGATMGSAVVDKPGDDGARGRSAASSQETFARTWA